MINKTLLDDYLNTLENCGMNLLYTSDENIEYEIFEESDIGIVSFFHDKNLYKLYESALLDKNLVEKSHSLRKMVLQIQEMGKWNIDYVRTDPEWKKVLILCDEIKKDYSCYVGKS